MRSRILVLSVIGAVAASASMATAAGTFESGTYKGTTEQGKPIAFKATRGQVTKMRFTTIAVCESGYGSRGTYSNLHAPIRNTRFEIKLTGDEGATTVTVKGRLIGPYAGGTIVDHTRVNPEKEGKPEPGGSDRCHSTVHWSGEIG